LLAELELASTDQGALCKIPAETEPPRKIHAEAGQDQQLQCVQIIVKIRQRKDLLTTPDAHLSERPEILSEESMKLYEICDVIA
jgi:hypothetical protein